MAAGVLRKNREPQEASLVATCLDARMGEAYLALYAADEREGVGVKVEDCLVDPQEYVVESSQKFFAAGPGWAAFPTMRDRHASRFNGTDFELLPSAEDLLDLARYSFSSGRTVSASEALPNYLRDKVTR
jgi:tRNA threonylcarbamoyladenosine biosynthesis protein TsaB